MSSGLRGEHHHACVHHNASREFCTDRFHKYEFCHVLVLGACSDSPCGAPEWHAGYTLQDLGNPALCTNSGVPPSKSFPGSRDFVIQLPPAAAREAVITLAKDWEHKQANDSQEAVSAPADTSEADAQATAGNETKEATKVTVARVRAKKQSAACCAKPN
eukprot:SAG31_NODE_6426_length_2025_cov_0.934579_4_plen_160_part_00